MMFDYNLTQTVAICLATLFSAVNAVFAAFMWRMRATFVPRVEVEKEFIAVRKEANSEFEKIERRIEVLDTRMRAVEANAAGAAAEIKGVHEGVARVERLTTLLVEFRFKEADAYGKA